VGRHDPGIADPSVGAVPAVADRVAVSEVVAEPFVDPDVVPAEVHRRAVRGLVMDADGRCLLEQVHLHADPGQGTWWELPGGGIDPGEPPRAALEREIAEETGLVGVRVGRPVATRRIRFRNRNRRLVEQHETIHLVVADGARQIAATPEPGEGEDLLSLAWFDAEQVAALRRGDPDETARKVGEGFGREPAGGAQGPGTREGPVPERLADLDCVGWSDERRGVPLEPAGATAHLVAPDGTVVGHASATGPPGAAVRAGPRDRGGVPARVVRDAAPWTPTVHALLRHLEDRGFDGAPRALGIDVCGREAVTYVAGSTGQAPDGPWAAPLRSDEGIAAVGALLRRLREAADGFVPPADGTWLTGPADRAPSGAGGTVAHGDVGWANLVWGADDTPTLIDWEFAQPAAPLRDLAQAACWLVPLVAFDHERRGFPAEPDRRARLHALAAGAGVAVDDVLDAVADYLDQETARIRAWGGRGIEPWTSFLRDRRDEGFHRVTDYLRANGTSLR
jgi:8-oxo-dGTP pyrophosphatase MutT (NUDIX family)